MLLLDRGADIHAVHGAGVGSLAGYAPQDKQPIDLAIWGGPCQVPVSRWRSFVSVLKRRLWNRWSDRQLRPCNVPLARLLISRGATYDLAVASALNDLSAVRSMLDTDPSRISEQRTDDRRPLYAAADFGRLDIVHLLLERGADPTWPDADSSERGAALHAAARRGDRGMVELLLEHNADPNGFVNASGNAVCAAKTPEIRKLLEAHGGFLDPYDLVWKGEDDEVMRIVTERPETALAGCGGVFTAVVTCGRRELMHRLLDAGFKVHPEAGGCHSYVLERPDMLRELLTRGGLDPNYPTIDGVTLLHELCHKDIRGRTMDHRTECAAILLEFGADPSPKDKYGETPLMWATKHALIDIAGFLKARGAT
ncbi:MAG TPA: ankyrin repeat domain-containing protein [Vicinamibacterales bacterium]|nr:ankyrin repeat domain-containing protein [Vicinamibacterales bacterium]